MGEIRIGTFICHCGTNIGGVVNVPEVTEYATSLPNVVFSQENLYTCSEGGLDQIRKAISEHNLNRVIVASCTPRTHEPLFKRVCQQAGLNPSLFEFVNIREQCSWVHMQEKDKATQKAKDLIRMGVAKVSFLEPQEEIQVEVEPRALVIGGGIAGLSAALILANIGFEVKLVEKGEELGGMLNSLYKLYPTNRDAQEVIDPKIKAVNNHPRIEVFNCTTIKQVKGFVGNYDITIARYGEEKTFKVGVIIVATGAKVFKPEGRYNYDGHRVITQLELEQILKGKELKANKVVMIQCVGSREEGRAYCSRICCMTAIKNAMLIKESNPQAQVFILYRDLQTYGVEYEQCLRKSKQMGTRYIKYSPENPPAVDNGRVRVFHQLLGREMDLEYDLLVLSTPLVAHDDAEDLSRLLKVPLTEDKFFLEAHVKLRPVDFATDGVYLCGCASWPSDIEQTVAQAQAAASRALIPLSRGMVKVEPIVSAVDQDKCIGCGICESLCPFKAIEVRATKDGDRAQTIIASCKGCGVCSSHCPKRAITMQNFTDEQIEAQIAALVAG
jgi:heterodisulfide reductase subunit A